MPQITKILFAVCTLLVCVAASAQNDVVHGHGALEVFDAQGMENTPTWVMVWIAFMALTFIAGLFFVKNHPIARWVVIGFVTGLIASEILQHVLGIPPYSGFIAMIHIIFWSPALFQLLRQRPFLGPKTAFSIWSGVITLVICVSFVFDFRDAFIFLRHTL